METPKEYYYTYYSYEEWGRGYFGSRGCECLPEEDINYLGSSKDKTFKPKYKIILKDDYATREEAYADEIILQEHYKVVENPHFANKAYQTSTKFYVPIEEAIENGKKGGTTSKKRGVGIHNMTNEERIEAGRKGGTKSYELGVGLHAITPEERVEIAKKSVEVHRQNNLGFYGMSFDKRSEIGKMGANKIKENKLGIFSMTSEELSSAGKKGGKIGGHKAQKTLKENKIGIYAITPDKQREIVAKTNSQRWMCEETGYISTPAGLSKYQKARGIDTSKRKRIS
jgi:general stress protein YciG